MGVIIRQSIKGTIANYIGIAIGFVTTFFVLTDYLTAEEIGLTRVLVDAAVLFSGLAQLGTTSSMMRYYPYFKDEKEKDHGIFFWSIIIPFVGFLIFLTLFFIFKNTIINTFSENSPLFVNYFYFVIPLAFFMLYLSVFEINSNVLMRIAIPKLIREVGIRAILLIGYILFGFHIITLDGLVITICATYGFAALVNLFYLLTTGKISFKPDFKHLTPKLKRDFGLYTLFLITAALAGNITPTLNSFFVSAKMGLTFTGIFAIANYISTVIEVPYRSLGAITQPQISQSIKDNNIPLANDLCKKVSLHQLLAGSFIFLCIWINIDLLFQILPNGEQYTAGKWVVLILAFAKLFNSSFSIGTSVLGYSRYYYMSLVFTLFLTFSAIFLNNKLIPLWGMNGAACATLFSYVTYYLLLLGMVGWKMKTSPFSWAQLKTIFIIALLFGIDYLIKKFISPLIPTTTLFAQLIECAVRTLFIATMGVITVYYCHISNEVNMLIEMILNKIGLKRKQ